VTSPDAVPFGPRDVTAGCENEFQVAVSGKAGDVDLPGRIMESAYFRNLARRVASGDVPPRRLRELQEMISEEGDRVWENSWVAMRRDVLNPYAKAVLAVDLSRDKRRPGALRADTGRFLVEQRGVRMLRIPVSYLMKLALAQAVGQSEKASAAVRSAGEKAMEHFLSDNTSPETYSFTPVAADPERGIGEALARETLRRFLLCQCLVEYSNRVFGLAESGQKAVLYSAPVTPVRQRTLNDLIPDQLYRDLFMSPCLSGWDQGEEKHKYMGLCHQVLSRSRLHTVAKLREAGIMASNLVVMPSISNTSLANNGTHVSLGSKILTGAMSSRLGEYSPVDEKRVGDLAIKIVEHFIPLFVDTYTAAPFRVDFWEFHPENVMGFLPHELDFTHLRMLWRRWKKKANLRVFGQPITPTGLEAFDRLLARSLGLRGDLLPDFRLLDYLVSPMSTDESPALDGRPGNDRKLRADLAEGGIFDERMSHYTLYRLREFGKMGFTGFEGRFYSVFPSLRVDMTAAVNLQALVTAYAVRMALSGRLVHEQVPDTPAVESERRQITFAAAIGVPTFYVRNDTGNALVRRLVRDTAGCRSSRRYPGYTRIQMPEYRRSLIGFLRREAADLVEAMNMGQTLDRLERTVVERENGATARLLKDAVGGSASAMRIDAAECNSRVERYYREGLRVNYLAEALDVFDRDLRALDAEAKYNADAASAMASVCPGLTGTEVLARLRCGVLSGDLRAEEWLLLIQLLLAVVGRTHGIGGSG
jgi:hypothetical protein